MYSLWIRNRHSYVPFVERFCYAVFWCPVLGRQIKSFVLFLLKNKNKQQTKNDVVSDAWKTVDFVLMLFQMLGRLLFCVDVVSDAWKTVDFVLMLFQRLGRLLTLC